MILKEKEPVSLKAYEIKVKGSLDPKWSAWFDGFVILPTEQDDTLLVGTVIDQSALHGLLAKIHDLGLPLISVHWVTGTRETNGLPSNFRTNEASNRGMGNR